MLLVCVCRPYIRCSTVSVREETGQCGGVQSGTVPFTTPGPCHFPLETPYTGLNSQAAVDLGSPHSQTGMWVTNAEACMLLE